MLGIISLMVSAAVLTGCPKKGDKAVSASELKTDIQKVSYIIGNSTGTGLREQSVDIDIDIFMRGLKDGLSKDGVPPAMTEEEMRETMQNFRTTLMEKRKKEMEEAGVKNQQASEKFLNENKTKPGVVTLPSGLQYKLITEGKGEKPSKEDSVTVDYTGTLLSGKTFDSTKTRGKPATFAVASTIPGMSEALQLMSVGSTWEIYIPANLAYGAQGAGATIGPNEVLTFNIHLISVEKAEKPKAEPKAAPKKK